MKFFAVVMSWLAIVAFPIHAEPVKLLVFGDSFAAGYGLPEDEGFCNQLEIKLAENGLKVDVINAGLSGDTSKGAIFRADATYGIQHDFVLLEIGANDMLRGVSPSITKANIAQLIGSSEKPVYLVGIRAFPSYGMNYAKAFDAIYPDLADKYETGFYPFLFEKVMNKGAENLWRYFQNDRLHPNHKGVALIVEDMAPQLVEWIKNSAASKLN